MAEREMKNAPPIHGWAIATAAGIVATAVSFLLVGIEGNGSVLIGATIALVVGIVFTIAERAAPPAKGPGEAPTVSSRSTTQAAPKPAAATTSAAPAAEAATPATAPVAEGSKPKPLDAPQGKADDLKQITGVGPVLEGKLNDMGIYHFWQIANWTDKEIAWVEEHLNFKGRIERDDWIAQAGKLSDSTASKPSA